VTDPTNIVRFARGPRLPEQEAIPRPTPRRPSEWVLDREADGWLADNAGMMTMRVSWVPDRDSEVIAVGLLIEDDVWREKVRGTVVKGGLTPRGHGSVTDANARPHLTPTIGTTGELVTDDTVETLLGDRSALDRLEAMMQRRFEPPTKMVNPDDLDGVTDTRRPPQPARPARVQPEEVVREVVTRKGPPVLGAARDVDAERAAHRELTALRRRWSDNPPWLPCGMGLTKVWDSKLVVPVVARVKGAPPSVDGREAEAGGTAGLKLSGVGGHHRNPPAPFAVTERLRRPESWATAFGIESHHAQALEAFWDGIPLKEAAAQAIDLKTGKLGVNPRTFADRQDAAEKAWLEAAVQMFLPGVDCFHPSTGGRRPFDTEMARHVLTIWAMQRGLQLPRLPSTHRRPHTTAA